MIRVLLVLALAAAPAVAGDFTYKAPSSPALTTALQAPKPAAPANYADIPAQADNGNVPPTLIPGAARPAGPNRYVTETYGTRNGQNCGQPDCGNVLEERNDDGLTAYGQQTYRKYHGGNGYHHH